MTDRVFIRGLKAFSVIGAYAWERDIRQPLLIDLELACDMSRAAKNDALDDALDYAAISNAVVTAVEAASFQLLEALAEHLANLVLDDFPVQGLVLSITKPGAVPAAEAVGVRIARGSLVGE
jgi:dihydroneopterin aldolase